MPAHRNTHGPRSSGPARPPPPARQLPQAQKKKMESDASFIPQLPVQESYAERIASQIRNYEISNWTPSNLQSRISDLRCRIRSISNFRYIGERECIHAIAAAHIIRDMTAISPISQFLILIRGCNLF